MSGSTLPFVTIVMPALDEERYIASAIASVLPDEDAAIDYEVIVADGGSVDATAKIVRMLARGNRAIRLVENVGRTQAAGVNLAARLADPRSSVLVRADCHAGYPADFVVTCVEALAERNPHPSSSPCGPSARPACSAPSRPPRIAGSGTAERPIGSRAAVRASSITATTRRSTARRSSRSAVTTRASRPTRTPNSTNASWPPAVGSG